jgi:hypothetical protein
VHSDDDIAEWDKVEPDPSHFPPAREEIASKESTLNWLCIRRDPKDKQVTLRAFKDRRAARVQNKHC